MGPLYYLQVHLVVWRPNTGIEIQVSTVIYVSDNALCLFLCLNYRIGSCAIFDIRNVWNILSNFFLGLISLEYIFKCGIIKQFISFNLVSDRLGDELDQISYLPNVFHIQLYLICIF